MYKQFVHRQKVITVCTLTGISKPWKRLMKGLKVRHYPVILLLLIKETIINTIIKTIIIKDTINKTKLKT